MALPRSHSRFHGASCVSFRCHQPALAGQSIAWRKRRTLANGRLFSCGQIPRAEASHLEPIRAAPEVVLDNLNRETTVNVGKAGQRAFRVIPFSPSYFTGRPQYTDDLLHLQKLLRKYQAVPAYKPSEAPRRSWSDLEQYRQTVEGEPVPSTKYARMVNIVRRLNCIHRSMMSEEVEMAIQRFSKIIDPAANRPKPVLIDEYGRAKATGRRKSSSAVVWLVEGDGQVLVNGKTLVDAFTRPHDRESAIWPLKTTDRLDKYNVWALVTGGGTTGQAEAITMGLGRTLLAHEPLLKTLLRRGKWTFCLVLSSLRLDCLM